MMQVENEYGSFGDDHDYLQYIADLFKKHNIDVPYFNLLITEKNAASSGIHNF